MTEQQPFPENQKRRSGITGCLLLFLQLGITLILLAFSFAYPKVFLPIFIIFCVFFLIRLIIKNRKSALVILGIIIAGVLITGLITVLYYAVRNMRIPQIPRYENSEEYIDPNCETSSEKGDNWVYTIQNGEITDSQLVKNDNIIQHSRTWRDYDRSRYDCTIEIPESSYKKAEKNRRRFYCDDCYWDDVYEDLIEHDYFYMKGLINMYDSIGRAERLNKREFAEMVVSSVQSIPYYWIVSCDCDDPAVADKINDSEDPCLGNIVNYGIQSPVEFMYNQKGDCDTRVVFLYIILKHFDYDVAILVSEHYAHAMLGINMSTSGSYLSRHGKKYYVWETTAEGMAPGEIPHEASSLAFWEIVMN